MLTIAFDQDEVMADLMTKWLNCYNNDYNDNLTREDIKEFLTDGNIDKYIKPECGKKIFEYFHLPGFHSDLKIIEGSQEVIHDLIQKGFNVCVATAPPFGSWKDKYNWIRKNYPFINPKNIIFTKNKALVNAHFLVDDGLHNLEIFSKIPIVYSAPWNINEKNNYIKVSNWNEIETFFDLVHNWINELMKVEKSINDIFNMQMNQESIDNIYYSVLDIIEEIREKLPGYNRLLRNKIFSLKVIKGGK